ncbi:MAG: hypothetical protein WA843_04595 [Candidatus Saccharimonadales bacterium]
MQYSSTNTTQVVRDISLATTTMERKVIGVRHFKPMLVLVALVVAMFFCVAGTSAQASSLHSVVPGGLSKSNATQAWSTLRSRAQDDPGLASKLAQQAGATSFNAKDFKPSGYSNGAPAGSTNSGVGDNGGVSSAQDTKDCNIHSRMLVLINLQTQVRVYVCTNCSNPRLYHMAPPAFHRFSKGTVLRYHKVVTKKFKVCGKQIITVTVNISGVLRARTWGKVSGLLSAKVAAAFKAQLAIKVKATCPAPLPPASVPAPQVFFTCPNGMLVYSPGSCNIQQNTAEQNCEALGGSYNGNTNLCTIIQVNGNCSNIWIVNGSGNTINNYQQGNCNQTPPPSGSSPPMVLITNTPSENMIPVGKNSNQLSIAVNASAAGGSLTIDPGIGGVSTCDNTTPQSSVTFSLGSGNNTECYILYAPSDADQPTSMTVTYTATLGTASDVKTDTFGIRYPTQV